MKFSKASKISFVTVLVFALVLWAMLGRTPKAATAENSLGEVKRKDLIQRVTISGRISSRKRLDVKPSFNGYVQKIFVKIGDTVKAGDPLVTFSPSLSANETNYPVRAAFTGRVSQILKTEGESVSETGDQNLVLRVEDLTQLYVLASVPELDIAKIKIGQKASVKVSSLVGESFQGKIGEISLSAKDKDRWASGSTEFQTVITLASLDPRLLPGMSALCDVVTNRAEQALVLAHEFIQQDDKDNYFVTTASGEKRVLKLGLQTDEGVEIKEGLKEGEKVRVIDFLNLPKLQD